MDAETKAKLIDQHIKLVAKEVQCIFYNYHFERTANPSTVNCMVK